MAKSMFLFRTATLIGLILFCLSFADIFSVPSKLARRVALLEINQSTSTYLDSPIQVDLRSRNKVENSSFPPPESQALADLNRRGEVELMGRGSSDSDVPPGQIAEKSDMDYFAFTAENLFESEHAFWYANWSLTRQKDPRWTEIGEWKLFAIDYFHTRNLECGSFWIDCKDMPGLSAIQALYPDDRVLARRVYFTSECYLIIRNYLKAVQTILDEVNLSLYGLIPEIVHTFTSQPNPSAQSACAMIGAVVDTLVNVGVTAVTGMMTSTVTSFYDKVKANVARATHDAEVASRWYTTIMTAKWIPNTVVKC